MTKQFLTYAVLLLGTLLWSVALVVPPVVAFIEFPASALSHRFYGFFSIVCHQMDSRSLHFLGYKLAVCARCTSIYLGFLAGVLLTPVIIRRQITNALPLLALAVLPMTADVTLDALGVHASTMLTRLVTGSIFGLLTAFIITPVFQEALNEIIFPEHNDEGVHYESQA